MEKEKLKALEDRRHRLVLELGDLEKRAEEKRSEIDSLTRAIVVEIRHRGRSK